MWRSIINTSIWWLFYGHKWPQTTWVYIYDKIIYYYLLFSLSRFWLQWDCLFIVCYKQILIRNLIFKHVLLCVRRIARHDFAFLIMQIWLKSMYINQSNNESIIKPSIHLVCNSDSSWTVLKERKIMCFKIKLT